MKTLEGIDPKLTLKWLFEMMGSKNKPNVNGSHMPAICKISTFFFCQLLFTFWSAVMSPAHSNSELNIPVSSLPSLVHSIRFENDIEFCGKKIRIQDQDIKVRLEKEMLLAIWDRPQVILWIKRAGRYFYHIETILKQHGLPTDYKYVPVVESALRPHAGSSKGAVGFWQFMRSTGKRYGLTVNSSVDERKNLFKSTDAAARYLKDLKAKFDSDFLALAAYNMGEYGLKAEIAAQKTQDFFDLYLPIETQRYIFKLISVKLILEQPEKYGFQLAKEDIYPVFAFDRVTFKTSSRIPIILAAQAADTSFKVIKDMNPDLRGYYLSKGTTAILVPKGRIPLFQERFEQLYVQWKAEHETQVHIVKKGESLTAIAKQYNLSLTALLKLNNLKLKKVIHPGDRLIVK
jgi:membrane-bound lytic murein transglycosylase D